jgi:Protein of unknown function (DUF3054)
MVRAMRAVTGAGLDLCCVAAFVVIGRASHAEGETLAGLARTSWPFLAGLAAGWLATRAWRRPGALVRSGVGVWLATVALGMVLRVVSGQGIAVAFVFVALAFLGLFMLGWRLLAGRFATSIPA